MFIFEILHTISCINLVTRISVKVSPSQYNLIGVFCTHIIAASVVARSVQFYEIILISI